MRWTSALVVVGLLTVNAVGALAKAPLLRHIRPLSDAARALVTEATNRSPFIRFQVDCLEHTDIVVYVALSMTGFGADHHGELTFRSAAGGVRYLMVKIDSWGTTPDERIELLGHELWHAMEVAAAPDVLDQDSFAWLYREIGRPARAGGFETEAARVTTQLVRNELTNNRPGLES